MDKKLPIALDAKDRMILYQLDQNSRQSFSEIGKKVKMPKNVVAYRVKRLIDEGVINGFYTIINVAKMGHMYIRLLLRLQNCDAEKEKDIVNFFRQKQELSWLAKVGDAWDYALVLLEKDINSFDRVYQDMIYKFPDNIAAREFSIGTEIYHFKNKFLHPKIDASYSIVGGPTADVKIDKIDVRILNALSVNARIGAAELAKTLRITPKTVIARIKRLLKEKIILEFRCNLNYEKLGYQEAHVSFILSRRSKELEKKFFNILAAHPNVSYISKSLGHRDVEADLLTHDQYDRYQIIEELKRQINLPIASVEVLPTYKIYDVRYSIKE